MSLIVQPAHVPLGWVTVGGQRLPVYINPPWQRMLNDVPSAISTETKTNSLPPMFMSGEGGADELEVTFVPGPAGPAGPSGIQYVLLVEETQVDDIVFVPR